MSNIQKALKGSFTPDRCRDILSQIGNSNSNLDLQGLLLQLLPVFGKVTSSENGNESKVNPEDLLGKLDSSIVGPLLDMMQCLQPEQASFRQDNGRETFNRDRINNWLNESVDQKTELLHSPTMNVLDNKQNLSQNGSYHHTNFSGTPLKNNRPCSPCSNNYQNVYTSSSSQVSPVHVNCSPNHTDSSFMNNFQQQISPGMEPVAQNHIMNNLPSSAGSEGIRPPMYDSDKAVRDELGRNHDEKFQEIISVRPNFDSSASYGLQHSSNILPSIERMRSSSPSQSTVERHLRIPENLENDLYQLQPASHNTQTSPGDQSSEDYPYSDDHHHHSQTTIKVETQESCEDIDANDLLVTSSGRNRGLGRANEPRFCCQVCGDVAAGFHCGAYVCEACKKFYLRCLKNGGSVAYSCPKTQECVISKETRSHCQFCRYQKCLNLGMYKPGRDDSKHLRVDFKSIPCKVCSAPSSGFHFGAITCEGCKGFFRRMVKEKLHKKFVCTAGGGCDVASSNRTACKACRYQKCLEIGMALEGTRLGRQSNSVKRNTLIQYLNNGMDVALFPKLGESETDEAQHKVDKLLRKASAEKIVTPQTVPDLVSVKQETEMDEGYLRYMHKDHPYVPTENSSHKNIFSGKDHLFVDTSDVKRSRVLDIDTHSIGQFDPIRNNVLSKNVNDDAKPFPWGTDRIMAIVDNVYSTIKTDEDDEGNASFGSKRKNSESETEIQTPTKQPKGDFFTSSNLNPPNSTTHHQRFERTSSIDGNERPCPKLSVSSEQSPLSLNSPNSLGSPSSQCSFYPDLRKDPRWCAVDGCNPNRKKLVKSFLSLVPQTEVDHHMPKNQAYDPQKDGQHQSESSTPGVRKRHISRGEEGSSISDIQGSRELLLQVVKAYKELEYITKRKREPLQFEKQMNEKSAAWWAAYESFMHHAKYTLRFVKKIPGFKDLDMEDQITLVRESVYPITLLHHAQFYDPTIKNKGWFCNTEEEKQKILHFFPKFKALETHLEYTGKLFNDMSLSLEENAFICTLMVFTIDSFLVKDGEAIQKIQNNLCDAFFAYCQETDTDLNRPGMLILRLAELKRANFEHTQIAIETQRENPDVDFSQLWHEMFLSRINCQ